MTAAEFNIGKNEIQWLKEYLGNIAPSGNEITGQKIWLNYIRPHIDKHITDAYGNVAAVINPDKEFKVVIEAHADEIAWYVHSITKDGFLHVEKNGGTDPGIAPSQRVLIRTESGIVNGIFGWPAVHIRKESLDKRPTINSIFIDCGCSSKHEVEKLGIQVGDCITYDTNFSVLNKRFFVGRGQDNKIGGFMLATIARLIRENDIDLPYALYIVNAVQEEVGLRGAGMMANRIKPDCAIVTDVTHATHTPNVSVAKEGDIELGFGPVIVKVPSVHNKLRELAVKVARETETPYQLKVASKKSGTDADAFAYTRSGIPSCLISLPLRYMHTTVETSHVVDIENTIRLIYGILQQITPDFNFNYFEE